MTHRSSLALALVLVCFGCDETTSVSEPLGDEVVLTIDVPPPTKVDLLFIVDDGPGMCHVQHNLVDWFSLLAASMIELRPAVELSVAVVRAGVDPTRGAPGAFVLDPVRPGESGCVSLVTNEPRLFDTQRCAQLVASGGLEAIVRTGPGSAVERACRDAVDPIHCFEDELEARLTCLASLGTGGGEVVEGLEVMRLALDCNGPNRAAFGSCCVPSDVPGEGLVFDATCTPDPAAPPAFLHPDALLLIAPISIRDDCSAPEGVSLGSAAECAWSADRLTPVDDYVRALARLKRSSADIAVLPAVGPPAFTPAGLPISWHDQPPLDGCAPGDTDDACCPEGLCRGAPAPSCLGSGVEAAPGDRYLALAEHFPGSQGSMCSLPPMPSADSAEVLACADAMPGGWCVTRYASGRCLPTADRGVLACAECPMVCDSDPGGSLVARALYAAPEIVRPSVCLDTLPLCQVYDDGDTARACRVAEEFDDPYNYTVEVRLTCVEPHTEACEGAAERVLARDEWSFTLDEPECASGAVVFVHAYPRGGQIEIRY